jgi:hypothetical protein
MRRLVVAFASPALLCGCFALFSLDDYGPNRGGENVADSGTNDDATTDGGGAGDAAKPARVLFVTSERFNGSFGGIAGADGRCTALAADAGFDAAFVAWVGSGSTGPAARIPEPTRAIVYPNGSPAAANLAELATKGPLAPITVTEKKQNLAAKACAEDRVWTNARANGTVPDAGEDCESWSVALAGGAAGQLGGPHDEWTDGCGVQSCAEMGRLYCFQK